MWMSFLNNPTFLDVILRVIEFIKETCKHRKSSVKKGVSVSSQTCVTVFVPQNCHLRQRWRHGWERQCQARTLEIFLSISGRRGDTGRVPRIFRSYGESKSVFFFFFRLRTIFLTTCENRNMKLISRMAVISNIFIMFAQTLGETIQFDFAPQPNKLEPFYSQNSPFSPAIFNGKAPRKSTTHQKKMVVPFGW